MKRLISVWIIVSFIVSSVAWPGRGYAQDHLALPLPGTMVNLSPAYVPVLVKGLKIHPENPLLFDFILDTGKSGLKVNSTEFKSESEKLIKYFLASLTIKEDDLWVNLSPYEKDRMIPAELGKTELGRDMLAQDYILKQLTASLIYPEKQLGKEFWDKVYTKAQQMFGTSDVSVNTFNKVWIVADKAKVLERNNAAYIVGAHLKVMLEEDYVALNKRGQNKRGQLNSTVPISSIDKLSPSVNSLGSQIVREIIIPELDKEVNQGQNFAPLRQMFYSMILASWYKLALKDALLNQVYANKGKIKGVETQNFVSLQPKNIYQMYLQAYKKGVFNYIKEESIIASPKGEAIPASTIPRKYFSGGLRILADPAQLIIRKSNLTPGDNASPDGDLAMAAVNMNKVAYRDAAMAAKVGKAGLPTVEDGLPWETKDYLDFLQKTGAAGEKVHFVARSEEMVKVIRQIRTIADSPLRTPTIVYGLTGTGKELTWKIIHYLSPRSGKQPIVLDVNWLNLYEAGDLNRVIFGTKDQPGLLEQGQDSTVVIDGIEDATSGLQGLLLRVLESTRMVRADGSAPINLSNVQFVATRNKNFPKGYRQDLVNRLRSQVNLPALDQRQDDRILLYEFYNKVLAEKLGQTWRPLSLDAGFLLASVRANDEKQVRGVQEVIENALTNGHGKRGPYLTAQDLIEAGLPTKELARGSGDVPSDINGVPIVLGKSKKGDQKVFDGARYLQIVHGVRPYYDLIMKSENIPVPAKKVQREQAQKYVDALNGFFTKPTNLKKLGVVTVALKTDDNPHDLKALSLILGDQLENGEYTVKVQFTLEDGQVIETAFVTGLTEGVLSLWVGFVSWMQLRSDYGYSTTRDREDVDLTKRFALESAGGPIGFYVYGGAIENYLNFYKEYDFLGEVIIKKFNAIKSDIPDAAMTISKFQTLGRFSFEEFVRDVEVKKLIQQGQSNWIPVTDRSYINENRREVKANRSSPDSLGSRFDRWSRYRLDKNGSFFVNVQNVPIDGRIPLLQEIQQQAEAMLVLYSSIAVPGSQFNFVGLARAVQDRDAGAPASVPEDTLIGKEDLKTAKAVLKILGDMVQPSDLDLILQIQHQIMGETKLDEIPKGKIALVEDIQRRINAIADEAKRLTVERDHNRIIDFTNEVYSLFGQWRYLTGHPDLELHGVIKTRPGQADHPLEMGYSSSSLKIPARRVDREAVETKYQSFVQTYPGGTPDHGPAPDAAMKASIQSSQLNASPGGIDLNAKNMGLDVAKEGSGVDIKFDPAMVAEFQRGDFSGIAPLIIRIVPITSALPILGLGKS